MVRFIYGLSVLALVATGGVAYLCAREWRGSAGVDAALPAPSGSLPALQAERSAPTHGTESRHSPLVAQAEALAKFLNPPPPPAPKPAAPKKETVKREPIAPVRPVQATPKFTLRATSYSESRPQKSMALIAEPGGKAAYWVREGQRIGHIAIHEIKPGAIVVQAGDGLREMALVRDPAPAAVAAADRPSLASGPQAVAASDTPVSNATRPSRRSTRRNRRTVGSARTMALR